MLTSVAAVPADDPTLANYGKLIACRSQLLSQQPTWRGDVLNVPFASLAASRGRDEVPGRRHFYALLATLIVPSR